MFRKSLIYFLVLFALFIGFRFHTFSISVWHDFIDQSPKSEILFGHARGIRSDDWVVEIPLMIAQVTSPKPMHPINDAIGLGQPSYVPFRLPSKSFIGLFRPDSWGFFIGPDVGMAWLSAFLILGLSFSSYYVFNLYSDNFKNNILGAALVVTSPFFQSWHYYHVEPLIHGFLFFIFFCRQFKALNQSVWQSVLNGLICAWSLTAIVVSDPYPPRVVLVVYLILVLMVIWLFKTQSWRNLKLKSQVIWLILTGSVGLGSLLIVYGEASESINAILNTTYPGRRISTGGGIEFWTYFVEQFFLPTFIYAKHLNWQLLENACAASSFFLYFPLIMILIGSKYKFRLLKIPVPYLVLFAFLIFLIFYAVFGIPSWLAQMTLMSKVISVRVGFGIGMASIFLLIFYFNNAEDDAKNPDWATFLSKKKLVLLILIWSLFLIYIVYFIKQNFEAVPYWFLTTGLLLQLVAGYLVIVRHRYALIFIFLMQAPNILQNPFVIGGSDYLLKNEVANKMHEFDKQGAWMVMSLVGDDPQTSLVMSNYPRILGLKSLGGYVCPPQQYLLAAVFDLANHPDRGQITSEINQCAFYNFQIAPALAMPELKKITSGNLVISIGPNDLGKFKKFGLQYLMIIGDLAKVNQLQFDELIQHEWSFQNKHVFRLR